MSRIEDLELERREWMASQRTVIREARSDLRALARAVRLGEETRDVEVAERPEFSANVVRIVRVDTGECIRTRPMDPGERQVQLALGAPVRTPLETPHDAEGDREGTTEPAERSDIASTLIRFDLSSASPKDKGDVSAEIEDPQAVLDAADQGLKPEI
ncbi:hypothetical protein LZC95_20470 [Pendulispora brunnea]|uniref:Uncharacterized protein n=1 Tax=Pendulispora brunnea TaxID=2905690 RepID=A0ABZ2KQ41_9BACT